MSSEKSSSVVFKNVNIFDGKSSKLEENVNVLIENNLISKISRQEIPINSFTQVIDCKGQHTLMPGLMEAHGHLSFAGVPLNELLTQLPSYTTIMSTVQAKEALFSGFTTWRDLGGEVFGLKRAIDENLILGPRIYPSGALIAQTSGHGDFRFPNQANPMCHGHLPTMQEYNYTALVDGVPKMLATVREQLRLGATQIKLCIGGGVASPSDPIDVTEFTKEEIEAAVTCASNWGTYVSVHGYTVKAVNQALDAGVKVIEHGHLLDENTLKRMLKEDKWLSVQPFVDAHDPNLNDAQNAKLAQIVQGTDRIYNFLKQNPDFNVVHGTDTCFNVISGVKENVLKLETLLKWFEPWQILKMATFNVGKLVKLSGPRNPYPHDLGCVKEGAYADLLLVNGNPLQDLKMVTRSDNLRVIMKDGKIHKNTL